MSEAANGAAVQLLAELESVSSGISGTARAFGAAMIEKGSVVCLAGFSGGTLAAPQAIEEHLRLTGKTRPAPFVVLTNDPYAGGISLNHLFLISRPAGGDRALVAALLLEDFGAMREGVFRHRREIFHEGLRLPPLPVDWDGPERNILLDTMAANVRHADAVYALIDRCAHILLTACRDLQTTPFQFSGSVYQDPPAHGRGRASASVGDGSCAIVHADLHASTDVWEAALSISGDAEPPLCAGAAALSSAGLALADAWNLPVLEALKLIRISGLGPDSVVATLPAAVGHKSAATTYACYRAVFGAAQAVRPMASAPPRDDEAFARSASYISA